MAKRINRLTPADVTKLSKRGRYHDGNGLYLQVSAYGSKSWIYRYTIGGQVRYFGLGSLQAFTLSEARQRTRVARQLVADGIDPVEQKAAKRAQRRAEAAKAVTFQQAAERCIASHKAGWSAVHARQWESSLANDAFPLIGGLDVAAIDTSLVLKVIEPLWREKTVSADRLRSRIEAVLDWARSRGLRSGENPARWRGHLDTVLPAVRKVAKREHFAAMAYGELPKFMAQLRERDEMAARALELTILTAVRTTETRAAVWSELDLDGGLWVIPAGRMKAGKEHRVPLPEQALKLLKDLRKGTTGGGFVFPGSHGNKAMGQNTMQQLLLRMVGEKSVTVHGFRSGFADWASEQTDTPREIVEATLAHSVGSAVEQAYRRTDALAKRRKLMESWSRFLSGEDADAKVIPMIPLKRG
jgi:integrase